METKRIDLPLGWSATIKSRDWLSEREARGVSRALVDSVAVGAKLTKAGFSDADPNTYDAFSALSDAEKDGLAAFQSVLVCQFTLNVNTGEQIVDGPFTTEQAEGFPQGVFDALASACLAEWQVDTEVVTDPKASTDA